MRKVARMSSEALLRFKTVREARLYEELSGGWAECGVCERRCRVPPGKLGFCRTRINMDGGLYTMVYGDISSVSANPIEKKPFFNFWPGSLALTVGTWSCNFTCPWCQNHEISKVPPDPRRSNFLSPETFVNIAKRNDCQGTSISFNEPTLLFEYSLDVFDLAHEAGLYNTYVSNGYMSVEALRLLAEHHLDAIKFDMKGDAETYKKHCNADVEVVWRNAEEAKRLGLHVEIVNLVIPTVNDRDVTFNEIAVNVRERLGFDVPLHFTAFYPAYRMTDLPRTEPKVLERAHKIALDAGLNYVYVGNVPGHVFENTYCPRCGELLIERDIFSVISYRITSDRRCPKCGDEILIIGRLVER
ncbi:MAG: AmmeMemoRadiSam system radical SAM enzyme [Candidatus Bathyarchaeia archaeon]